MVQGDARVVSRCDRHRAGWDLVAAAQRGDRDAFGRLYDRYVGEVFGFALARVGDRGLAEDLTSETFLRALRGIGSLRYRGCDVGAWLVTITKNLVAGHFRSRRHRLEVTTGDLVECSASDRDPEAEVLHRTTAAELMRAVARLGPDQQQCITLRFVHGLSVAQTAAAMDRTAGAIRALQHRGVRTLAQLLATDQYAHSPHFRQPTAGHGHPS